MQMKVQIVLKCFLDWRDDVLEGICEFSVRWQMAMIVMNWVIPIIHYIVNKDDVFPLDVGIYVTKTCNVCNSL